MYSKYSNLYQFSQKQKENINSLNILEMAEQLNDDDVFSNFTDHIQTYSVYIDKCSALIKFNDNCCHYFTVIEDDCMIIRVALNGVWQPTRRQTMLEYIETMSMNSIEYMLIHYIGRYMKFTDYDTFVNYLYLCSDYSFQSEEIFTDFYPCHHTDEYKDIEQLLYVIDYETTKLGSLTCNKRYKNLIIVNYSGNHNINFNIFDLNVNYKINIINNVLIIRFSKDTELNEFISKLADIINDKKNYVFLIFANKDFKIHDTDELIDVNRYLTNYYTSGEDFQMLLNYNRSKSN